MKKFQKIALLASLALALSFIFSCTSSDDDNSGENPCRNNELFGCPYGNLSSSSGNDYGSKSLLNMPDAQYSANGTPPDPSWSANETFNVDMNNTIISDNSTPVTITSSKELKNVYIQFSGNTGYYTVPTEDNLVSMDDNNNYVYIIPLKLGPNLANGDISVNIRGSDTETGGTSKPTNTTVTTLASPNNNNYGTQSLLDGNAQYYPSGNLPAPSNWTGTFTVNIGSTVISGGSAIATITSYRPITVLYIQLGGNNGYYIINLDDTHLVSSANGVYIYSVTLQFNQRILSGAFLIRFIGAEGSNTAVSSPTDQTVETRRVGGGALQISLSWDKAVDLDLHVKPSWGDEIYYARKIVGNGNLDLDMICRLGNENVYFSTPLRDGDYTVYVNLYSKCSVGTATKYVVSAYANGNIMDFAGASQQGEFAPSASNRTKRTIGCINVTSGVITPIVCGSSPISSSSSAVATTDISGVWNTADGRTFNVDGTSWTYSQNGVPLSKGTWANGATSGKIVLTATQYYSGGDWTDIPAALQLYKTNTIDVSFAGTTMILSNSTAPALAASIWGQIEGTYTISGVVAPSSSSSSLATSSSSSSVVVIEIGGPWNTADGRTFVLDGNSWIYSQDGVYVSRGTWANGGSGKIVLTAAQYYSSGDWIDIPIVLQPYKTNTLDVSINATGTTMILSNSTAPALAAQIWGQIEGTYTRGSVVAPSSSSPVVQISSSSVSNQAGITYGPSVTYEGETYQSVVIGTQTWMARNLNYAVSGSKCYNNDATYCPIYGRLYDWATAMVLSSECNNLFVNCSGQVGVKHKGICPAGWHIPSYDEWLTLVRFVGTPSGTKLKAKSYWKTFMDDIGNGTDDFGFAALPGSAPPTKGIWWSATQDSRENSSDYAKVMSMEYNESSAGTIVGLQEKGYASIRCLQD